MRRLARCPPLLAAGMLLALPVRASGQPAAADPATATPTDDDVVRAEAQALFDRGLDAFDAGRIEEACGLFQRSFDVRPSPSPLYNLGYCRKELGDAEGAVVAFRRYVELTGTDLTDAEWTEIEGVVHELGGTIERPQDLVVAPPPPPPPPPPPLPPDDTAGVDSLWLWTTAGTAVALGITAGITGGVAYNQNQDYRANGDPDLKDTGETLQLTTNVLAGIAGAAAVAAVVLIFFTDWDGESAPDDSAASVSASLAPGGLVVTW